MRKKGERVEGEGGSEGGSEMEREMKTESCWLLPHYITVTSLLCSR